VALGLVSRYLAFESIAAIARWWNEADMPQPPGAIRITWAIVADVQLIFELRRTDDLCAHRSNEQGGAGVGPCMLSALV